MVKSKNLLVDFRIEVLQEVIDLQRRPADDEDDENYENHFYDFLLVLDEVVVRRVRRMVSVGEICVDGQIGEDEHENGKQELNGCQRQNVFLEAEHVMVITSVENSLLRVFNKRLSYRRQFCFVHSYHFEQ